MLGQEGSTRLELFFFADYPFLEQSYSLIVNIGLLDKLFHALHVDIVKLSIKVVSVPVYAEHRFQGLNISFIKDTSHSPCNLFEFLEDRADLLVASLDDLEALRETPFLFDTI